METADLLALARRAVSEAQTGEAVEAYAAWERGTEAKAFEGEVESLSSAETSGLGVRVIAGARLGYAYAADPDPEHIPGLVEQARANSAFATPDQGNVLPEPDPAEPLDGIALPDLLDTPTEEKVALALEIERIARGLDPRIRAVETAVYGEDFMRRAIVSTTGVEAATERGDCSVMLVAMAEENGETQTGFGFELGRRPRDLDLNAAATEAVERATRLLGATKPKTERMPVILEPYPAASFLGVLAAALTAEAVLKGRSLFADKVGQKIAAPGVSLVDDGRLLAGPGAEPFDGEGVPTGRTALVEAGTLTGFLHNTYTAARMGARSTGNARRGGFRSTPGVAPTNLFLEPGADGPSALLARAGRALLVQELLGVHSGANPISGDFSVGVSGVLVEGGAAGRPVREATIASTITDILGGIAAVGSDLRFFPFGGAIGAPTVLVGEMTVAGT